MPKESEGLPRARGKFKLLQEERGAGTILMALLIMFVFMLTLPFLLNFVSLHISRRVAQTGADAAALAAAEEYAKAFSQGNRPDGCWQACCRCDYSFSPDMAEYRSWVGDQFRTCEGRARAEARSLADANGVEFRGMCPGQSDNRDNRARVRSVLVDVRGDRRFPVLMQAVYGRGEDTAPAVARAEA